MSALGRTFYTKNLQIKTDMATARRGRPACATTRLRALISFRFYRETAKSLQEFLIG